MKKENNYEFRKRLLSPHKKDILNKDELPQSDDFVIGRDMVLYLKKDCGEVAITAAEDFADFLFVSMGVSAKIKFLNASEPFGNGRGNIFINTGGISDEEFAEAAGKKGYIIKTDEKIEIFGYDERGTQQALYHLEDIMSIRHAPFIKKGVIPYEPMPYQWLKRYEAMREANEKWGLCGIMESHHYGFYPSFISKLSKMSFMVNKKPCESKEIMVQQFHL